MLLLAVTKVCTRCQTKIVLSSKVTMTDLKEVQFDCALCGKLAKANKCGACKKVHYCSKECQKAHWKEEHKKECEELKACDNKELMDKLTRRMQLAHNEMDKIAAQICTDVLDTGDMVTIIYAGNNYGVSKSKLVKDMNGLFRGDDVGLTLKMEKGKHRLIKFGAYDDEGMYHERVVMMVK